MTLSDNLMDEDSDFDEQMLRDSLSFSDEEMDMFTLELETAAYDLCPSERENFASQQVETEQMENHVKELNKDVHSKKTQSHYRT